VIISNYFSLHVWMMKVVTSFYGIQAFYGTKQILKYSNQQMVLSMIMSNYNFECFYSSVYKRHLIQSTYLSTITKTHFKCP